MSVNPSNITPSSYSTLAGLFSPDRLATYRSAASNDPDFAVRLYHWNTSISAAFYESLQSLEVAMRNAMHRELSAKFGQDWYDNLYPKFDQVTKRRIDDVKGDLSEKYQLILPSDVVANLSFGFWVTLLGPGGYKAPTGPGKADYSAHIWRPALYKSFPHARKPRKDVHSPFDYLRTFRNRIAHHEPIFDRHLSQDYAGLIEVAGWISPDLKEWIAKTSRVPNQLLADPFAERIFLFQDAAGI